MLNCPQCGAEEMPISHIRTFYLCKSSDHEQRPGTFSQSMDCERSKVYNENKPEVVNDG